jgi:hypothetical protein
MKIYEFLYNDCIYESASRTVSIHRTKLGAYKAMNKFINDNFMKEYNERIKYGKDRNYIWIFGVHEWWGVKEIELQE